MLSPNPQNFRKLFGIAGGWLVNLRSEFSDKFGRMARLKGQVEPIAADRGAPVDAELAVLLGRNGGVHGKRGLAAAAVLTEEKLGCARSSPTMAPSSSWVKVPRVIAIRGFLSVVRRDRPGDVSGLGDRNGAAVSAGSGRSASEGPGRRKNFPGRQQSRPPRGRCALRIFPVDRLAAAGSSALRDMPGPGLRKPRRGTRRRISEASEPGSEGALADVGLGLKIKLVLRVRRDRQQGDQHA
jgi:hypothetical protein